MICDLPNEIIIQVVENAYYNQSGYPDHRTLHRLSAVSHQWTTCTQPLLWSFVNLRGSSTSELLRFGDLVRDNGRLLKHVRALSLSQPVVPCFKAFMGLFPHLYELRLSTTEMDLPNTVFELPSLQSLVLESWPTMSNVPFCLLQRTPNLRFLRLNSELASPRVPADPPRFRLYELALRRMPREMALEWLRPALVESLEIIDTFDAPSPPLEEAIERRAAHIRSVRVHVHNFLLAKMLKLCTALEEYKMNALPKIGNLRGLPQTLQHLAFANWANDPVLLVVEAVLALPNLRTVTHDTGALEQPDFHFLQEACRKRGFPIWNSEDAVEVEQFPRTKSVSNLKLMRSSSTKVPSGAALNERVV
ncbi:hypothetical protein BKA62DRAFT_750928 [Auriculariales sp. MPI-PUGE-AT-0066]|nr:hypothetical protein BKA62DRAFT_750928 [Auriculariales sp. MPI-PUGE-AT-0066]